MRRRELLTTGAAIGSSALAGCWRSDARGDPDVTPGHGESDTPDEGIGTDVTSIPEGPDTFV